MRANYTSNQDPRVVGQRPEERLLFDGLLASGLTDVVRAKFPEESHLFTWWPYWRQAREKNVGWRIDYMLASARIAERVTACVSQREFGASDHAPLVIELEALP